MDRPEIISKCVDEIIEVLKFIDPYLVIDRFAQASISSAINSALTEYAITLIQIQQKAIMGTRKDD